MTFWLRLFRSTRQQLFWLIAAVLAGLLILLFGGVVLAAGGREVALLQPAFRLLYALDSLGFPLNPFEIITASVLVLGVLAVQRSVRREQPAAIGTDLSVQVSGEAVKSAEGVDFARTLHTHVADLFGYQRSHILVQNGEQIASFSRTAAHKDDQNLQHLYDALDAVRNGSPADESEDNSLAWVELVLPLRWAGKQIGLWALGGSDRAKAISPSQEARLAVLANWAGIILYGYLQAERAAELDRQKEELNRRNLEEQEADRQRLALELHDDVLQALRRFYESVDPKALSPELARSYTEVSGSVRRIISEQRPVTLDYGLGMALEELTENHVGMNRAGAISSDIVGQEVRYPVDVETHLFRIVQQALDNAIVHSQAQVIRVQARLNETSAQILVADDGVGIPGAPAIDLAGFGVEQHFGLLGMARRAKLAGADLKIDSTPNAGTRIRVHWQQNGHHTNGTGPT